MATITYNQSSNSNEAGIITFNGVDLAAMSAPANNGRLDTVGDLVFAEFGRTRVECIRTSNNTMTIRVLVDYNAAYYTITEAVVEDVPIDFDEMCWAIKSKDGKVVTPCL